MQTYYNFIYIYICNAVKEVYQVKRREIKSVCKYVYSLRQDLGKARFGKYQEGNIRIYASIELCHFIIYVRFYIFHAQ